MNSTHALERLYELQSYSLPRFVLGASPFVAPGDEQLLDVLRKATLQQERMASQLAEAIRLRNVSLPKRTYPMQYSSLHDLELRYLFDLIIDEQRRVVSVVDELAHSLREDKAAQRLAHEVRRNETAHLRLFEEIRLRYPTMNDHRCDEARTAPAPVTHGTKLPARAA